MIKVQIVLFHSLKEHSVKMMMLADSFWASSSFCFFFSYIYMLSSTNVSSDVGFSLSVIVAVA